MRLAVTTPPEAAAGPSPLAALAQADALYGFACHLTHHRPDAEDLVQETYARALNGWDRLAPGGNLRAWLLRILRNTFLDRARTRRRQATEGVLDEFRLEAGPGREDWLRGDAELERLRGLVGEEIQAALATLPEPARIAILLDAQGLSEGEVALTLGCPTGTVKSRLSRARAALRVRLADYRPDLASRPLQATPAARAPGARRR